MSEEYEIIFITEEGRAIKNNKTGKIYHSEFEIIEEKNKEIDRLNNITKNQDRKIKLAIKIFENINKIYGESSSINDVIDVLKEE